MPKIGTKSRTAKVYDKEYADTAAKNLPKSKDVSLFDSLLQDIALSVLRDHVQQFAPEFVDRTSEVLGQRFKDIIQPPGTRFFRQGTRAVAFCIEVPPSVRTLSFKGMGGDPHCVSPRDAKFSLALPYLYFIPVFGTDDGHHILSAVGLLCRTEPLEDPDDMMHCINLPNVYNIQHVPERIPQNGIIPDFAHSGICQGYVNTRRETRFAPKENTFAKMTHQVLVHFWSSRFTHELSCVYHHMRTKDQRFESLETWQQHSQQDPLFVLGVKYPPAIKLSTLFNDIMRLHDHEANQIRGQVNDYVAQVQAEIWEEIRRQDDYQKIRVDMNQAVLTKFEEAMKRFSVALSTNLSSIDNDVIKRHVLLAITFAMREALK